MTIDELSPADAPPNPAPTAEPTSTRARRPARRIERRRSLPSGRAVVGALLVTVAALGVFWAYLESGDDPARSYVVVASDLAPGERIEVAHLRLEPIDLPADVAAQAFSAVEPLAGAVAIGPLASGQLLQAGDLLGPNPGQPADDPPWREVSFLVPDDRALGGRLRSGERIDLIATYEDARDSDTVVVFENALLVRVAEPDARVLGGGEALIYTVALDEPTEVLATVNAVDAARSITLVRSTTSGGLALPSRFDGRDAAEATDDDADGEAG